MAIIDALWFIFLHIASVIIIVSWSPRKPQWQWRTLEQDQAHMGDPLQSCTRNIELTVSLLTLENLHRRSRTSYNQSTTCSPTSSTHRSVVPMPHQHPGPPHHRVLWAVSQDIHHLPGALTLWMHGSSAIPSYRGKIGAPKRPPIQHQGNPRSSYWGTGG